MVLESIDYKKVFYYFEKISEVPRGSKFNQGISDYLVGFAKENGLEYVQDEALNVIIKKEATKGYEHVPAVIIQGHMDMVCEKNSDTFHDFTKQGLNLKVDGDYIYAEGTTLGGDDGIALAYAMAILTDDTLVHPKLEVVFTTDEEIGMDGAVALDTKDLTAKYMLNIDSEEEGKILAGCAGGMTSTMRLPINREVVNGLRAYISIKGLFGGHSGVDITKNRTNANILLGRLLQDLRMEMDYACFHLNGGLKDNAIPRESFAQLIIDADDKEEMNACLEKLAAVYKKELAASEPELEISVEYDANEDEHLVLTEDSFANVLFTLLYAPNGIQKMSSDIEGLVESSLNLGIFKMKLNQVIFSYSVRSSISTYKKFMSDKLQTFIESLGGTYKKRGEYPSWEYIADSKLRDICTEVYTAQNGKAPEVEVIHAGLECGLISEKMPGLDIVSIGPDILDIHTPNEKLSISSAKRVYDFVVGVLEAICKSC